MGLQLEDHDIKFHVVGNDSSNIVSPAILCLGGHSVSFLDDMTVCH